MSLIFYRHRKGGIYRKIFDNVLDTERKSNVVIYECVKTLRKFARPLDLFYDPECFTLLEKDSKVRLADTHLYSIDQISYDNVILNAVFDTRRTLNLKLAQLADVDAKTFIVDFN